MDILIFLQNGVWMLILYDKAGKTDHKGLWDLLFVTITGTLLSVLFTTTLAYPMSRKDFKFSKILTFLVFLPCCLMEALFRPT